METSRPINGPQTGVPPYELSLNILPRPKETLALLPPLMFRPNWQVKMITSFAALKHLARQLSKVKEFSLDSETFGLPGEPLDEHLSLIQIGVPKLKRGHPILHKGTVFIVDVLALQSAAGHLSKSSSHEGRRPTDPLAPLRPVLKDKLITKIIHHAQFEREQFDRYNGTRLEGVFDTEAWAKRLRPYLPAYSLGALAVEVLGYSLDKEAQTSDWSRRPLTQKQLDYAALDAQVTFELKERLAQLAKGTEVKPGRKPADMLREIVDLTEARQRLFRAVGNHCGVLDLRIRRQKQELTRLAEALCLAGAKKISFKDAYGTVLAKRPLRLSLKKLEEFFPGQVQALVKETVSQKALQEKLIEQGFPPTVVRKTINSIFEITSYGKPTLRLSLDYNRMYQGLDSGLKPFEPVWKTVEIGSDEDLQKLTNRLRQSKTLWLETSKAPNRAARPPIVIGIPADAVEEGTLYVLPGEGLSPDQHAELLNTLQLALSSNDQEVVLFDCAAAKRALKPYGLEVGAGTDIKALAKALRPDLAAYDLRICLAEILGIELPPNGSSGEAAMALYKRLCQMELAARPPITTSDLLGGNHPISVSGYVKGDPQAIARIEGLFRALLAGILQDTAERLSVSRAIGNTYDALGVRIANLRAAIKKNLLRRRQDPRQVAKTKPLEEQYGRAQLIPRPKRSPKLDLLRAQFPNIAREIVSTTINRAELRRLLSAMDTASRTEFLKHISRPDLSKPHQIKLWPKYKKIYQGLLQPR